MNHGRNSEKILLGLGLILIFSSSPAKSISEFKFITDYLFYSGGLLILIVALSSIIKKDMILNKAFKVLTSIYGFFIILVIVSTFVNQNLETEIETLQKFILIYFFFVVCLAITDVVSEKIIMNSLIISIGIIFIYFLIEYPLTDLTTGEAYTGGFSNPNVFGLVAVTLFSASLVAGTSLLKASRNYILAILYLSIALGVGYLTMISNSRTSFISLAIVFGIVSVTFTYDVLKARNLLSWKSVSLVIFLTISGIALFVLVDNPVYTALESSILDKNTKKMEAGRLTAGRADAWKSILADTNMFGTANYFEEHELKHAHNSFLQIVVNFGWFTGIAYIIFWIGMLVKSIQHYLTEKTTNIYAVLPLVAVSNFILLSMTELAQFHVSTYLAISMVAIFSKPKNKHFHVNT